MRRFLAAASLLALAFPLEALAGADEFYLARLKAGKAEVRLGRTLEAEEDLRIACFGLMDDPPLLVECLGRLAMTRQTLGKLPEMDLTLARLVEVEGRFGVWEKAAFEPALRAELEQVLLKRLGADGVRAVPSLSGALVKQELDRIAKLPPAERVAALDARAKAEPGNAAWPLAIAREAQLRKDWVGMEKWADRALEIAPASAEAKALRDRARATRIEPALAESRQMIQDGRYREALKLLAPLIEADPANRELRKGALEAAVLTKDWRAAASNVPALKPFRENEETSMFYGAVALWETGSQEEARDLAKRSYPLVAKNAFVEFYGKRILEP